MAAQPRHRFRLAWYARWLLILNTFICKWLIIRIPARAMKFVTNRSWRMSTNGQPWVSIQIDEFGRIVK